MSEAIATPGPVAGAFAGTPVRDLIAGATAFGVVVLGANIMAHTLKGAMDESVRSGAVGVLFASIPAVYGVMRKVLASVGPKPAKPAPELAPWYITALFAAALLFAWSQFFGFIIGVAAGAASTSLGQDPLKIAGAILGILQLPLLIIWGVVAGKYVYAHARSWIPLAVLLTIILVIAMNLFMNFVIMRDSTAKLMSAMETEMNSTVIIAGLAMVAMCLLIGMLIGVAIGAIGRARSKARVVSLFQKLDKSARGDLLDDLRERVIAQAKH